MPDLTLGNWLKNPRTDFKESVFNSVRSQVRQLKAENVDFYGYAVHAGVDHELGSLAAVWNCGSELAEDSDYDRFCVDEWAHWDHDSLASVTPLIARYNDEFARLHAGDPGSSIMDDYELLHIGVFHEAILEALHELSKEGVLPPSPVGFSAIWISDSDADIISRSVQVLNPPDVAERFLAEFG